MGDVRHLTFHAGNLDAAERWSALGHVGVVVWMTGLSGSGKSTVARHLEARLLREGRGAVVLDGDNLRLGLNSDLGFSDADRHENVRRVSHVASLVAESGSVAIVPIISPFRAGREEARVVATAASLRFLEVFVDTPLDECERRDPKGLYAKARRGEVTGFTGIDSPYEAPENPDIVLSPDDGDAVSQADRLAMVVLR